MTRRHATADRKETGGPVRAADEGRRASAGQSGAPIRRRPQAGWRGGAAMVTDRVVAAPVK